MIDIILSVNCILQSECNECSDVNYDFVMEKLDIIINVNLILESPFCLFPKLTLIPDGTPLIAYGESFSGWDPSVLNDEETDHYKVWHLIYRNQILGIGYGVSKSCPKIGASCNKYVIG